MLCASETRFERANHDDWQHAVVTAEHVRDKPTNAVGVHYGRRHRDGQAARDTRKALRMLGMRAGRRTTAGAECDQQLSRIG